MIAQFTPLHQQAVEVMARAVHDSELERGSDCWYYYGDPRGRCSMPESAHPPVPWRITWSITLFLGHFEAVNDRTLEQIVRAAEEALSACLRCGRQESDACHDSVAYDEGPHLWHQYATRCARCRHDLMDRSHDSYTDADGSYVDVGDVCAECGCIDHLAPELFDLPAFFAAIVLEGIAKGELLCNKHRDDLGACRASEGCRYVPPERQREIPSWFDSHAQTNPPIIVPALVLSTESTNA